MLLNSAFLKRAYEVFEYKILESKEEKFRTRRYVQLSKMIEDYWGFLPRNLRIVYDVSRPDLDLEIDGSIKTFSWEPEIEWVNLFRKYRKAGLDIKKPIFQDGVLGFKLLETSVGTTVLGCGLETTAGLELFTEVKKENGEIVKLYKTSEDDKYYEEITDMRIRHCVSALDNPRIVTPSKLDPVYYEMLMNEYEHAFGHIHDKIVANLLPYIEGRVVVPADGLGRWAKFYSGPGFFTDQVKDVRTNSKVVQMTISETLYRERDVSGSTFILMYCAAFFSEDDWKLLTSISKRNKILMIDTRQISKLQMRSVNNMVWEIGFPEMKLVAFPHDTILKDTGIKYSSLLLSIQNPLFLSTSIYSDYYKFMKPFHCPTGEPTVIYATLKEYIICAQNKYLKYAAFAGIFEPIETPFVIGAPLYVRTIYSCKPSIGRILPKEVIKEEGKDRFFFCYVEAAAVVLTLEGVSSNAEYRNFHLMFKSIDVRGINWTVDELVLSMFPKGTENTHSLEQIKLMANHNGLFLTDYEIHEAMESHGLRECDGKYTRHVRKRPKVQFDLTQHNVPEFMQWAAKEFPDMVKDDVLELAEVSNFNREAFVQYLSGNNNDFD
jgi:hypothetical protein